MSQSIVMFAKAPEPGRVKTRLAASVGDRRAARFHAAFIADVAATVASTVASSGGRHLLAWSGERDHAGFDPARALDFEFVEQPATGLGDRLDQLVRREATRSERVVVIGSDSPTLMPSHFESAFERLEEVDVVIGPSFDGGYYLIGVRSGWYLDHLPPDGTHPLFREIAWSTRDVLKQTLRRCQQISCLCDLTAFWYDVDTVEDLNLLATHLLEHLRPSGKDLAPNTAVLLADHCEENPVPTPREG